MNKLPAELGRQERRNQKLAAWQLPKRLIVDSPSTDQRCFGFCCTAPEATVARQQLNELRIPYWSKPEKQEADENSLLQLASRHTPEQHRRWLAALQKNSVPGAKPHSNSNFTRTSLTLYEQQTTPGMISLQSKIDQGIPSLAPDRHPASEITLIN
jgi:hypothetical protein